MAEKLPIYEIEPAIVSSVREHRRVIISAPTGSGKSTQVPQILLGADVLGTGQVVILQPRRLATRLLAARVAWERKSDLGQEVGYQIRFENATSPQTRIRFVTEGVLLRQMVQDPKLAGVSALIFDEFHERHLYGDITLDEERTHDPSIQGPGYLDNPLQVNPAGGLIPHAFTAYKDRSVCQRDRNLRNQVAYCVLDFGADFGPYSHKSTCELQADIGRQFA